MKFLGFLLKKKTKMKASISCVRSLARTITRYNTIARYYKLPDRCPEITNLDMGIIEYQKNIIRLEKFVQHPFILSKAKIHPSNIKK